MKSSPLPSNDLAAGEASSSNPNSRNLIVVRVIYFLFFSGFGLETAYLTIYFHSLGLSGVKIGYLSGTIMLVGLVMTPVWGYLNDMLQRPRLVLALVTIGSAFSAIFLGRAGSFPALVAASAGFGLFFSSLMPLIDRLNMSLLGADSHRYAQQRIWGSIGFIVTTVISGIIFDRISLQPMFIGMAFFFTLVAMLCFLLPRPQLATRSASKGALMSFLTKPEWVLFTIGLFLLGIPTGWMNNFLGVYMRNLGGRESLVGLSFSVGAIAELPVMYFSPRILRRSASRPCLASP